MGNDKLQVGFIGTGGVSIRHGAQLKELPEANIAAIADISEQSRQSFISRIGLLEVSQFADYRHMLDAVALDAVIICSPHTLHFQHAKDALERGCHVMIEKPMVCSSRECEGLMELAEARGKVLQVSYQRHFMPEYMYIKQAVEQGVIGRLTSITTTMHWEWQNLFGTTWRMDPSLSGGGMLMDAGSHVLDILLWTTGLTPKEVSVQMHRQGTPVEVDSFTAIAFEEGTIAGVNMIGCSPCDRESYAYCGEKGAIFLTDGAISLHLYGQQPVHPELPEKVTNQDKSFVDAILGRHEVMIPGDMARKVVRLTEMIYRAAGYEP